MKTFNANRRSLLLGSAAATLGLALSPRMGWADAHASILESAAGADIDWKAFDGEEIIVGAMQHPWSDSIESALPIFEELTGIKVKLTKQSETEYVAEMPIKLGAGSAEPDVMMIHALGQFVSAGWAAPLDQFYEDSALFDATWFDEGDMFGMARDFPTQNDGQRFSMSVTAEAQTLFANQRSLDAAGLEIPRTMDDEDTKTVRYCYAVQVRRYCWYLALWRVCLLLWR